MPVDALFKRSYLEDFIHGELARLGDISFDGNHPVGCFEFVRVLRGVRFVRTEFVEIVVVRNVLVRVLFLGGAEGALYHAAEFRPGTYVL